MKDTQPKKGRSQGQASQVSVAINYQSPEDLRTNYLTGVFAAPTPEGTINVVGFVERKSFPKRTIITAAVDGKEGKMEDEGDMGWIREIQSSFLISVDAAEDLVEVLQEAIEAIKIRRGKSITQKKTNE